MTSPRLDWEYHGDRSEYGDRVIHRIPLSQYRNGVLNPHSLHGPVYAFPAYNDSTDRVGSNDSSPGRHPHVNRPDNTAVRVCKDDSQDVQAMEFSTAARLLGQSTSRAHDFFHSFQAEFKLEIRGMEYATLQTMNQIWRNKIQFNEKGHHKRQSRSRSRSRDNPNNESQPQDNQNQNDKDSHHSHRATFSNRDQHPIFHHLTQDLYRRIQDFNHALLPHPFQSAHLPPFSSLPFSSSDRYNSTTAQLETSHRHAFQKYKAARSLQRKIRDTTAELARYLGSMRTNHEDMQSALTEMENISDLLMRYWHTWGNEDESGDGRW